MHSYESLNYSIYHLCAVWTPWRSSVISYSNDQRKRMFFCRGNCNGRLRKLTLLLSIWKDFCLSGRFFRHLECWKLPWFWKYIWKDFCQSGRFSRHLECWKLPSFLEVSLEGFFDDLDGFCKIFSGAYFSGVNMFLGLLTSTFLFLPISTTINIYIGKENLTNNNDEFKFGNSSLQILVRSDMYLKVYYAHV